MMAIRFAAFTLAATCLIALAITPNSPATIWLTGFFFTCFAVVAWSCRETNTRRRP